MWRLSFFAIIWAVWKDRNKRCFEGVSFNVVDIVEKARFIMASWVSILPSFSGLSMDMIMLNWLVVVYY